MEAFMSAGIALVRWGLHGGTPAHVVYDGRGPAGVVAVYGEREFVQFHVGPEGEAIATGLAAATGLPLDIIKDD